MQNEILKLNISKSERKKQVWTPQSTSLHFMTIIKPPSADFISSIQCSAYGFIKRNTINSHRPLHLVSFMSCDGLLYHYITVLLPTRWFLKYFPIRSFVTLKILFDRPFNMQPLFFTNRLFFKSEVLV